MCICPLLKFHINRSHIFTHSILQFWREKKVRKVKKKWVKSDGLEIRIKNIKRVFFYKQKKKVDLNTICFANWRTLSVFISETSKRHLVWKFLKSKQMKNRLRTLGCYWIVRGYIRTKIHYVQCYNVIRQNNMAVCYEVSFMRSKGRHFS